MPKKQMSSSGFITEQLGQLLQPDQALALAVSAMRQAYESTSPYNAVLERLKSDSRDRAAALELIQLIETLKRPDLSGLTDLYSSGAKNKDYLRSLDAVQTKQTTSEPDLKDELAKEREAHRETKRRLAEVSDALEKQKVESEQTKTAQKLVLQYWKFGNKILSTNFANELCREKFESQFASTDPCLVAVVSIDIRKSTDLMLKAKSAYLFAGFIKALNSKLEDVVKENFGVIDKFTGDGLLCYFPEFYSGNDFAIWALKAAIECHQAFAAVFEEHKSAFKLVPTIRGVGIGMDCGEVQLVEISDGKTVIGEPVVYACRLASCDPRKTLINRSAIDSLKDQLSHFKLRPAKHGFKHDDKMEVHDFVGFKNGFKPGFPDWFDQTALGST